MMRSSLLITICTFQLVAAESYAQQKDAIDDAVAAALVENRMPGCVVLIGRRGEIVFEKAYGNRQVKPKIEPMTVDTVFDLASLTKPIATATSVMLLVERGESRTRCAGVPSTWKNSPATTSRRSPFGNSCCTHPD